MKIFVVDDEQEALLSIKRLLKRRGINDVSLCDNGTEAIERIKNENFDIVLLDLLMPDVDGTEVLEKSKPYCPATEFVILTAIDDIQSAVKAIRMGAYDYLVKPAEPQRILLTIERAYERKGLISGIKAGQMEFDETEIHPAFKEMISGSRKMKEIFSFVQVMARSEKPFLITGESGTGKELMARAIHKIIRGDKAPFVAVNVASVPDSLFESQFFGHTRGAFTGAAEDHKGFFRQADGGTLFLDEIGEFPLNQQAKLLRVLEEKSVTPLGSNKTIPVDFNIISATNADIEKACREGHFRLDLLYRLKSAFVHLPPLRERVGDIKILSEHFLKIACKKFNKNVSFGAEVTGVLEKQIFPGNVRELGQLIENAVIVADKKIIPAAKLGLISDGLNGTQENKLLSIKENEQKHIEFVLNETGGDKKKAAQILGISLRQLQRKIASSVK